MYIHIYIEYGVIYQLFSSSCIISLELGSFLARIYTPFSKSETSYDFDNMFLCAKFRLET